MRVAFLTLLTITGLAFCAAEAQAQGTAPAAPKAARTGILLFAHGGRVESWNEEVRHIADQVDLKVPTEVAFGMATRSSLQGAADRLNARGVTEIVAVPLFVSSHSSVIESTAYLLGLKPTAPEDLKMFAAMDRGSVNQGSGMDMSHMDMEHMPANAVAMQPIHSKAPIHMASALDHHVLVADILRDRAATISKNPAQEVVILVAHGPVPDDENLLWLADMKVLAEQVKTGSSYSAIDYMTLRDDADDPVRDKASSEVRDKVQRITNSGKTALIVPLLLSFGGIENGLQDRLKGLAYRMPTQGVLPDVRIVTWVLDSAAGSASNTALKAVSTASN